MKLPVPPQDYLATQENQRNRLIEQADSQNYKRGQDVRIDDPADLILTNLETTRYIQAPGRGEFHRTTSLSISTANTAESIPLTTSIITQNIALGTPASRIVVTYAGLYKCFAKFQFLSGSASDKTLYFWWRKNGTDVANSSFVRTLHANTEYQTLARTDRISLSANDYLELYWASDSTDVSLAPTAATSFAPASPACTVYIDQLHQ
jgi:hypothetical protein